MALKSKQKYVITIRGLPILLLQKIGKWKWRDNKCRDHKMTRKLSELSESHYVNNHERTSLLTRKRLQNHIFY